KRAHHALAEELRAGERDERAELDAVVAREHAAYGDAGGAAALAAGREGAGGERVRVFELYGLGAAVGGRGEREQGGEFVVEEGRAVDGAEVRRDEGWRGGGGVEFDFGRAKGDDGGVGVEGLFR